MSDDPIKNQIASPAIEALYQDFVKAMTERKVLDSEAIAVMGIIAGYQIAYGSTLTRKQAIAHFTHNLDLGVANVAFGRNKSDPMTK